jgi:hypothetical protein
LRPDGLAFLQPGVVAYPHRDTGSVVAHVARERARRLGVRRGGREEEREREADEPRAEGFKKRNVFQHVDV